MEVNGGGESGKKVMVAVDEDCSSYYALMWVLENLRESIVASGNPLLIYMARPSPNTNHVLSSSLGSARMYCPITPCSDYVNSVNEQNKMVSHGILEKAKSICSSRGINAETILEIGEPKESICNAVKKHKIKLLVMAEHEIGTIKRAFLWSVSNYCVQYASCPVLVVKKQEGSKNQCNVR
ncbi:universal stress protein A-like protein [Diospyros lotus]|uniref:universal stress protein A-like protein n=1 Tax=Diospyros lotus TaxID=55363 RepID=UPI0022571899|nr:universal stress protein A-like protein [Diospyros lotus]